MGDARNEKLRRRLRNMEGNNEIIFNGDEFAPWQSGSAFNTYWQYAYILLCKT